MFNLLNLLKDDPNKFNTNTVELETTTEQTILDQDSSANELKIITLEECDPEALNTHGPDPRSSRVLTELPKDFSNGAIATTLKNMGEFKYEFDKVELKDSVYLPPIFCDESESVYIGQWYKGVKQGRGRIYWANGAMFEGYFENGKANGKGRLTHPDGDVYVGDWVNDKSHGFGKYIKLDGSLYEGQWKEDKKHGFGKEIYQDGTIFEGEYVDGQKGNKGKIIFPDGDYYEGEFYMNNIHGFGEYVWSTGRRYKGEWFEGEKHGKGESIWPDGRKFVGEYEKDKKIYGELSWPDGSRYKGFVNNGLRHGDGVFIDSSGVETIGKWDTGNLIRVYSSSLTSGGKGDLNNSSKTHQKSEKNFASFESFRSQGVLENSQKKIDNEGADKKKEISNHKEIKIKIQTRNPLKGMSSDDYRNTSK